MVTARGLGERGKDLTGHRKKKNKKGWPSSTGNTERKSPSAVELRKGERDRQRAGKKDEKGS